MGEVTQTPSHQSGKPSGCRQCGVKSWSCATRNAARTVISFLAGATLHGTEDMMTAHAQDSPSVPSITVGDVTVRTEVLRLPDGRRLAWSEFGAPRGPVLMHCHGTPSSRMEGLVLHQAALGGVRVIVPDRPGFGRSDPQPGRSLSDWPRDIAELADHLGIQRFAVSGISGGGPHALACAALLGDRVRVVVPVNASPEAQSPLMRELPWRTRLLLWFAASPTLAGVAFAAMARNPRKMVEGRLVGAEDRRFLHDEHLVDSFVAALTEGLRQGSAVAKQEVALVFTKRWNIQWRTITQPVYLFQASKDPSLPFYQRLVQEFPNAQLREFHGTHITALAERVWRAVIPMVQAADG